MRAHFVRLWTRAIQRLDERGAAAVEYGLLLAAVTAVIVAAVAALGQGVIALFGSVPGF